MVAGPVCCEYVQSGKVSESCGEVVVYTGKK